MRLLLTIGVILASRGLAAGQPLPPSNPGTLTMARQLPSGVNIAILMNTRFDRNRVEIDPLAQVMRPLVRAAVAEVS